MVLCLTSSLPRYDVHHIVRLTISEDIEKKAFAGNKERPGGLRGATNLNSGQNEIGNVYVHYRAFKLVRKFKGKNL